MPTRRILAVTAACLSLVAVPAVAGVNSGHPAEAHHSPGQHADPTGVWVAGDLHVHTIYGHDTCITPTTAWDPSSTDRSATRSCQDAYTVGFTPAQRLQEALDRGLGFVAITDHNNVVNQGDPAVTAWEKAHPSFISVPGYENSQPGHVQMLGATACYGNDGRVDGSTIECDQAVTDKSAAGETALANGLRADGGVFQINHPSDGNWLGTFGYSVVPDNIEVWNIGPWAYQHPFPASNDNNFSLNWYDGFLRQPNLPEIGVTGGSDTHWVTTDAIQGVGDPTTWVYVHDLSIQGVLDGLRAHHTFVSALPPSEQGPQLFLEADNDNDGTFESVAGDDVGDAAAYRVRTVGAVPGSTLRIVTDTGSAEVPLGEASSYDFTPGQNGIPAASIYVRAELLAPDGRDQRTTGCDPVVGSQTTICRDDLGMESLSSPIFIRDR